MQEESGAEQARQPVHTPEQTAQTTPTVPPPPEGQKQTIHVDFNKGQVIGVENFDPNQAPAEEQTPEAALSPEETELKKQQLKDTISKKFGLEKVRAEVQADPTNPDAQRLIDAENRLQNATLEQLQDIEARIDQQAETFRGSIASKLVAEGDTEAESKMADLTAELRILEVGENTYLAELQNLMVDLPDGDPVAAQQKVVESIKEMYFRQIDEALANQGDLALAERAKAMFDTIYQQGQDIESALAVLVGFKALKDAGIPLGVLPFTGEDENSNPASVEPVAEDPQAEAVSAPESSEGGEATVVISPDEKLKRQQLRDQVVFAFSGWAKSSLAQSSMSRFIDNFFGQYDGAGGGFGYGRDAERWQAPAGKEAVTQDQLIQRMKAEGTEGVGKALAKMYSEGVGEPKVRLLEVGGLNAATFGALAATEGRTATQVRTALNEVVEWLFEGTTEEQQKRQNAWNLTFAAALFADDKKALGQEGMYWFAQQYNQPDKRWAEFAWQEQAAVAA